MKILHSADWHLGSKNLKLPAYQQKVLREEGFINLQCFFDEAYSQGYDVVLICGDLFHSKSVSQKLYNAFVTAVKNFARPVLYVQGNHDENIFADKIIPQNFHILSKSNPSITINNVNFYSQIEGQTIDQSQTNVLLLHGNIETMGDNDYVNINKYFPCKFTYIAMGHIHQMKKYKKDNNIFAYSGSLFSNGFDECGDKGFLQVVIEDKKVEKVEFKPFATRRYMICECDISSCQNSTQIIKEIEETILQNSISTKDIVRVVLKGSYDERAEKSLEYIKQHFNHFFYFELKDESTLKLDIEKIKQEKLSFKYEFITLVENSDLPQEDKKLICEIGLEALKGEEINLWK